MENKAKIEDSCGMNPDGLHLSRQEMLDLASNVTQILVDRIKALPAQDAWDGEFRQELDHLLKKPAPEGGRPAAEVIEQAASGILPLAVRLQHPRCFGFVPSSTTWPGVLADFLAAGFNNKLCTWLTSSGPSQIELVVLDWIRNWLGYPETAGGLLTSGSSAGSVEAFVAARESAGHPDRATVYMSDQSHYALVKAAMVVGVRHECIRKIPSDENFCLDMEALANAVAEDRAAGFSPILIAANAGTTGTGAVDPLEAIADYCEANSLWFHVDAAYGGFACVTERGRKLMHGIERADSVTLDAHKWFLLRGRYSDGKRLANARGCVRNASRHTSRYGLGCQSPEYREPRYSVKPFVSGAQNLDVCPHWYAHKWFWIEAALRKQICILMVCFRRLANARGCVRNASRHTSRYGLGCQSPEYREPRYSVKPFVSGAQNLDVCPDIWYGSVPQVGVKWIEARGTG